MPLSSDPVSAPISRWLTSDCLSAWSTSIGSSSVTMWAARWALTWSMIPATVVVLPDAAAPVTMIRPWGLGGDLLDHRRGGGGRRWPARRARPGGWRARATPLAVHVDPEAAEAGDAVGDVDLAGVDQLLGLRGGQELGHDLSISAGPIAANSVALEPPVDPQVRRANRP